MDQGPPPAKRARIPTSSDDSDYDSDWENTSEHFEWSDFEEYMMMEDAYQELVTALAEAKQDLGSPSQDNRDMEVPSTSSAEVPTTAQPEILSASQLGDSPDADMVEEEVVDHELDSGNN